MNTDTNTITNDADWPQQSIRTEQQAKIQPKANQPELEPSTLKGVYHKDGELYRAAIRPLQGSTWYNLGYFMCPHVAAYVFNVYALTMGLPHLVNYNLQPDAEELAKWRNRRPENAKRENLAAIEMAKLEGSKQ